MSKKKAAATMSLKEFHGGSIPSDLSLPSAPGVMTRSDSGHNMSAKWGNNVMRSDLRPRPKSSGVVRSFDEKSSFLSHPAPIGQNFDEDERKPLDGLSASRRTTSDERSSSFYQELKPEYVSSVRTPDRPVSSPVPQSLSIGNSSSPGRTGTGTSVIVNSQYSISSNNQVVNNSKTTSGTNGQGMNNNPPNAWTRRKDVMGIGEAGGSSSASTSPNAASKFAQASALEKVSSGMWQSKNTSHLLPHLIYSKDGNVTHSVDVSSETGDYVASRGIQGETVWAAKDGNQDGGRELPSHGRDQPQMYAEEVRTGASSIGSQLLPAMPPEISERHKLKLLPRSKPMETSDGNYRWGYQQTTEFGQIDIAHEVHENATPAKLWPNDAKTSGGLAEKQVERPKLNLKPRSQPLEQSEGSLERERNMLFGGARPRELVLKERGIDDLAINKLDLNPKVDRSSSSNNEMPSEHLVPTPRHVQKIDTPNRRMGRDSERTGQRMDHEKTDVGRRNLRNDQWRNSRDAKDGRPEPETWRKPVEEPKAGPPDASGIHKGKVASALDLAQAFSKSVSDPKRPDPRYALRSPPGRTSQEPFSRLTDTRQIYSTASPPRHRING